MKNTIAMIILTMKMLLMDLKMILLRRDLDQRLCIVVAYYNVVAYYYDGDGNAFDGYEDDD